MPHATCSQIRKKKLHIKLITDKQVNQVVLHVENVLMKFYVLLYGKTV